MKKLLLKIKKINRVHKILLVLLALALAMVVLVYIVKQKNTDKEPDPTLIPEPTQSSAHYYVTSTPSPIVLASTDIKWLDEPVKVPFLNVFRSQSEINSKFGDTYAGPPQISNVKFYKIASLSNGNELIKLYEINRLNLLINIDSQIFFEIKDGVIARVIASTRFDQELSEILKPGLNIAYGVVGGLEPPEEIYTEDGTKFVKVYSHDDFNNLSDPKFVSNTAYGPIYVTYEPTRDFPGYFSRAYYLRLKDYSVTNYKFANIIPTYDDGVQKITWLEDKSANTFDFRQSTSGAGCGEAYGDRVMKLDLDKINKKVIGLTINNEPVYQAEKPELFLLPKIYEIYKTSHSYPDSPEVIDTYDQFIGSNNYFIWQDKYKDLVVFIKSKYSELAECGKPVIYLYPEKEQDVKVGVGAEITKSEPIYEKGGWKVHARPNGNLTYKGSNYDYLYWEGRGAGIYPDTALQGIAVKKDEVELVLGQQLKQLGLNDKESSDFLDFWLKHLPNKPYIKITWLNTDEMNNLAPLTISPKPDTLIRVFVEFTGLDQYARYKDQKLTSVPRKGFTVVEWGGLLFK